MSAAEGSKMEAPVAVIGVLGAGTMGSGIAQLAARSGARTLLYDPVGQALERGLQRARKGLEIEAAKGRIEESQAQRAKAALEPVGELSALAPCGLVIEAAPERLEVKHALLGELCPALSPDCVIATNTSSIPVSAVAAGASNPERVVGMHFFNPAPLMRLVEVIAGLRSAERALAIAEATGRAMGKSVIRAADVPGFLVNRCNRPFGLEALRLLGEQIADIATIDRIVRQGGGFPMGPFELSDLVGIDTGFDVARSFYELSFGEPRWRPSTIAARYVAAGLHGRKSGQGYFTYSSTGEHRPPDPEPPAPERPEVGGGMLAILGQSTLAGQLRSAAQAAGYRVADAHERTPEELPALIVDCETRGDQPAGHSGPQLLALTRGSLASLDPAGSSVGFHALAPFDRCALVECTRGAESSPTVIARTERLFRALGKHVVWVGDAPGLVLGRIVCQLVNEAAFALGEGVGSAKDIDTGMVLGLNHPRGPLEWADMIGLDHVLAVIEALHREYGEERYRPAPALRRNVLAGRLGVRTGAGFFDYRSGPSEVVREAGSLPPKLGE
jgi:3-hydroxybutyryl-CoA dehydrogenase